MPLWKKVLAAYSITILVSSCTNSSVENNFSKSTELPSHTKTRVTDHVACFGDMVADYNFAGSSGGFTPLRFAVISARDKTSVSSESYPDSEIPNDFTDMVLGIITRIGGPIQIVHIPSSQELVDAVRYGSIPGKKPPYFSNFQSSHYRSGTSLIYGALTEYDRIISGKTQQRDFSTEFGSGRGETNIEASIGKIKNHARMTMDFRIVDPSMGDVVNHSSSSNTVTLRQLGKDKSFGLSIDGNSIGYSSTKNLVDARHQAIRMLMEWGLIETLGKHLMVPYWKCLPNSDNSKVIGFEGVVESSSLYDFHSMNRSVTRQGVKSRKGLVDLRDRALMNAVISYYSNAEYTKDGTRRPIRRPDEDAYITKTSKSSNKGKVEKYPILGKSTLIHDVLLLYKKNVSAYELLEDQVLLNKLHAQYVKAGLLHPNENKKGGKTFLTLWLNAPVKKNARWRY